MKPVRQTIFGDGKGNCFAACIASILELPLDEVPNFCAMEPPIDWWDETQKWLVSKGLSALEVKVKDKEGNRLTPFEPYASGIPCVVSGKSPRGSFAHCVVGRTGADGMIYYAHDPHPDDKWIDGDPTHIMFFVPLNPAVKRGVA